MNYSKLKIIFCIAVCLTMLSAPFTLEFTPDGKALAMGSRGGGNGGSREKKVHSRKPEWAEYKTLNAEGNNAPPAVNPVPEPATMLLVGGGLAGLAIFRKKFKK